MFVSGLEADTAEADVRRALSGARRVVVIEKAFRAGGGGVLFAGPMDIPAGRFAVLADPTGAMFAVIALAGG